MKYRNIIGIDMRLFNIEYLNRPSNLIEVIFLLLFVSCISIVTGCSPADPYKPVDSDYNELPKVISVNKIVYKSMARNISGANGMIVYELDPEFSKALIREGIGYLKGDNVTRNPLLKKAHYSMWAETPIVSKFGETKEIGTGKSVYGVIGMSCAQIDRSRLVKNISSTKDYTAIFCKSIATDGSYYTYSSYGTLIVIDPIAGLVAFVSYD